MPATNGGSSFSLEMFNKAHVHTPNESVEKVIFLKSIPSANSKI
jgi:hypothetical protein